MSRAVHARISECSSRPAFDDRPRVVRRLGRASSRVNFRYTSLVRVVYTSPRYTTENHATGSESAVAAATCYPVPKYCSRALHFGTASWTKCPHRPRDNETTDHVTGRTWASVVTRVRSRDHVLWRNGTRQLRDPRPDAHYRLVLEVAMRSPNAFSSERRFNSVR